jgi:hypothetical protein
MNQVDDLAKHDWAFVPPVSMYESLYKCTKCKNQFMESADSGKSKPEFGCVPRGT